MFNIDQEHPLPEKLTPIQSPHVDVIIRIMKNQGLRTSPNKANVVELDENSSRYFTLSKDGLLSIFSLDWTLQRSVLLDSVANRPGGTSIGNGSGVQSNHLGGSKANTTNVTSVPKSHKTWMSDFVCMPSCSLLAVGSTEYEIVFYKTSGSIIQKAFAFVQLSDCALTLDYWFDWHDARKSAIVWGDTRGCITIVKFDDMVSTSLFTNSTNSKKKSNSGTFAISLQRIIAGEFGDVTCKTFKLHTDWVRQVRFMMAPGEEVGGLQIVSCCVADDTALCFSEYSVKLPSIYENSSKEAVGKRKKNFRNGVLMQNRKSHFHLRKGILCFDFDIQWNLIVTGSRDCDIRVWNPYVAKMFGKTKNLYASRYITL